MKGLFYILAAYLLGEVFSILIGRFLPASVLGMLILFVALRCKAVKLRDIKIPSRLLLDNMILFFVPVVVGLMSTYVLALEHLWAILVSVLLSTMMVIVVVGHTQQNLGGKR